MKAYYYSDLLCKESKWSKVKCCAFINVTYLLISVQDDFFLGLFIQKYDINTAFSTEGFIEGGNKH